MKLCSLNHARVLLDLVLYMLTVLIFILYAK